MFGSLKPSPASPRGKPDRQLTLSITWRPLTSPLAGSPITLDQPRLSVSKNLACDPCLGHLNQSTQAQMHFLEC